MTPISPSFALLPRYNGSVTSAQSGKAKPAGVCLGLANRILFAAIIFAAILFPRGFSVLFIGIRISPINIVFILAVLWCTVLLWVNRELQREWSRCARENVLLIASLVAFIAWQFLSDVGGEESAFSVIVTMRWIFNVFSSFVIGSVFFLDQRNRKLYLNVLLVCLGIVSTIGVFEHLTNTSFQSYINVSSFAEDAAYTAERTQASFRDGALRVASVFAHPIVFGQFVGGFFPVLLFLFFEPGKFRKVVAAVVAVLGIIAILSTGTRSSFVVLAASVCVYGILWFSHKKGVNEIIWSRVFLWSSLLAVICFGLMTSAFNDLIAGRSLEENRSTLMRTEMIQDGLYKVQFHPIIGYGAGRAGYVAGMQFGVGGVTFDNLYVSNLLDFGWGGGVLFAVLILAVFNSGKAALTGMKYDFDRFAIFAFLSFTAALLVGQYVLNITDNLFYIFLAAGYFFACTPKITQPVRMRVAKGRRAVPRLRTSV